MSSDNVWEQKHAATSSIQSSDLLGGYGENETFTIDMRRRWSRQWSRTNEDGSITMGFTSYCEGEEPKEVEVMKTWWEDPEPQGPVSWLKSLFT